MFGNINKKFDAVFRKLRSSTLRHWFDWRCRKVLEVPPATLSADSKFVILTMTCHRDVIQYLVAIKSFTRYASPKKVVVLNDGSLTEKDRNLISQHVPGIEFLALDDFSTDRCPRGGCWERLLAVAELAEEDYVVQMDADTLTRGHLDEVLDCIENDVSFVLSTGARFRDFESMQQRNQIAKKELADGEKSSHVQFFAELNLDKLEHFSSMKYIRGCAGFSGFAAGTISRGQIEDISSQMLDAIGDKWREWGSEQVMSNIVVANSEKARVLPHPTYSNCYEYDESATAFIHFIGICRFISTDYTKKSSPIIHELGK